MSRRNGNGNNNNEPNEPNMGASNMRSGRENKGSSLVPKKTILNNPINSIRCTVPEGHILPELYLRVENKQNELFVERTNKRISFMGYELVIKIKSKSNGTYLEILKINEGNRNREGDETPLKVLYQVSSLPMCTKDNVYRKERGNMVPIPLIYALFEHVKTLFYFDFKKMNTVNLHNMLLYLLRFREVRILNQLTPSDFIQAYPQMIKSYFVKHADQVKAYYREFLRGKPEYRKNVEDMIQRLFAGNLSGNKNQFMNIFEAQVQDQIPIVNILSSATFLTDLRNFLLDNRQTSSDMFKGWKYDEFIDHLFDGEKGLSKANKISYHTNPLYPLTLMKKFFNDHLLKMYYHDTSYRLNGNENPFKTIPASLRFPSSMVKTNLKSLSVNTDMEPIDNNFLHKFLYLYTIFDKRSINTEGDTFDKRIKMLFIQVLAYNIAIYEDRYQRPTKFNMNIIRQNPYITLFYINHTPIYEFIRNHLSIFKSSRFSTEKDKILINGKVLMDKPGSGRNYQEMFDRIFQFIQMILDPANIQLIDELKEELATREMMPMEAAAAAANNGSSTAQLIGNNGSATAPLASRENNGSTTAPLVPRENNASGSATAPNNAPEIASNESVASMKSRASSISSEGWNLNSTNNENNRSLPSPPPRSRSTSANASPPPPPSEEEEEEYQALTMSQKIERNLKPYNEMNINAYLTSNYENIERYQTDFGIVKHMIDSDDSNDSNNSNYHQVFRMIVRNIEKFLNHQKNMNDIHRMKKRLILLLEYIEMYKMLLERNLIEDYITKYKNQSSRDNLIAQCNDLIYNEMSAFIANMKIGVPMDPNIQTMINHINDVRREIYEIIVVKKKLHTYGHINSFIPNYSEKERREMDAFINELQKILKNIRSGEISFHRNQQIRKWIQNMNNKEKAKFVESYRAFLESHNGVMQSLNAFKINSKSNVRKFGNAETLFRKFIEYYKVRNIKFER